MNLKKLLDLQGLKKCAERGVGEADITPKRKQRGE
jgi:hypothetical protein